MPLCSWGAWVLTSFFHKNKIYLLLNVSQLAVYKPVAHQSNFQSAIHIRMCVDCVGPQRHLRQALLRVSGEPRRGVGLRALGPAVRRRLVATNTSLFVATFIVNAKQNKQRISRLSTPPSKNHWPDGERFLYRVGSPKALSQRTDCAGWPASALARSSPHCIPCTGHHLPQRALDNLAVACF